MLTRVDDLLRFGDDDHAALTYQDVTLTYRELRSRVARAAEGLRGLEPGARVAIYAEKRLETVVAVFAVAAAGGVFVPINPLLQSAAGRVRDRGLRRRAPAHHVRAGAHAERFGAHVADRGPGRGTPGRAR